MRQLKKVCHYFLAIAMVMAMFVGVTPTQAAVCPVLNAGDVFKVPALTTVYMVNDNGERLFFPSTDVYHSWLKDFSDVVTIDPTCVDNFPPPQAPPFGVTYRPGSQLLTTPLTNKVYVLLPGNMLQEIGNEAIARGLYGDNWTSFLRDVPEVYWNEYDIDVDVLDEVLPHDGMLIRTPDGQHYIADEGLLFPIDLDDVPDFMRDDIHEFDGELVDAFDTGERDSDDDLFGNMGERSDDLQGEDIPVEDYTYTWLDGPGGRVSMLYPENWAFASYSDIDVLLAPFDVEINSVKNDLVDFMAVDFKNNTGATSVAVIVQPLNGDLTGALNMVQRLQSDSPSLHDSIFEDFDLTMEVGEPGELFIDGNFATGIDVYLLSDGVEIMRYTVFEVATESDYFMIFATGGLDVERYDEAFAEMLDSIIIDY